MPFEGREVQSQGQMRSATDCVAVFKQGSAGCLHTAGIQSCDSSMARRTALGDGRLCKGMQINSLDARQKRCHAGQLHGLHARCETACAYCMHVQASRSRPAAIKPNPEGQGLTHRLPLEAST